uniref:Ig-like domain-containing protein n=1 Tax=Podarcis muralis TaxID=64176 RepID=A0A670I509_PODMU
MKSLCSSEKCRRLRATHFAAGAKGQDLEVLQPPGPLSVSSGESLTLTCTVHGTGPPGGVKWHKGSDRKQSIYSERGQYPSRVTRIDPTSETDFSIRISNIRPEDAGTYYCVKYRAGSQETELKSGAGTEVSVIGKYPSISPCFRGGLSAPLAPEAPHYESQALDTGTDSRVRRLHPDSQTDFSILIPNIELQDAGTYYCAKEIFGMKRKGKGSVVSVVAQSTKSPHFNNWLCLLSSAQSVAENGPSITCPGE